MKICSVICEFNPFHNGHQYFLQRVREITSCDYLLCIMSGSFTQRGEIAVIDKYTRAKYAVLGGADCVLELPAIFSVAPAEIFAKGAIKIISAIPSINALAFGCENADKNELLNTAKLLGKENKEFKNFLLEELKNGQSYIKSYLNAFEKIGGNKNILQQPNNILAIEYIKAINYTNNDIEIFPVKRIGADFNDGELKENFSSASAIRQNSNSPKIINNVPPFVFKDLKNFSKENELYEKLLKLILSRTNSADLKKIYGCTEGLENTLKHLENLAFNQIIDKSTSKRYPSSRIKRILCANFLGLYKKDCEIFLKSNLYLTPLAVKKESAATILSELAKSQYPIITSGSDIQKLNTQSLKCKKLDDFAFKQWQQITEKSLTSKMLTI